MKFGKWLILIIAILSIFSFVKLGFWYQEQMNEACFDVNSLGAVGDFFGGMLNPLFALFAFLALLYTIHLQRVELKENQNKIEEDRLYSVLLDISDEFDNDEYMRRKFLFEAAEGFNFFKDKVIFKRIILLFYYLQMLESENNNSKYIGYFKHKYSFVIDKILSKMTDAYSSPTGNSNRNMNLMGYSFMDFNKLSESLLKYFNEDTEKKIVEEILKSK